MSLTTSIARTRYERVQAAGVSARVREASSRPAACTTAWPAAPPPPRAAAESCAATRARRGGSEPALAKGRTAVSRLSTVRPSAAADGSTVMPTPEATMWRIVSSELPSRLCCMPSFVARSIARARLQHLVAEAVSGREQQQVFAAEVGRGDPAFLRPRMVGRHEHAERLVVDRLRDEVRARRRQRQRDDVELAGLQQLGEPHRVVLLDEERHARRALAQERDQLRHEVRADRVDRAEAQRRARARPCPVRRCA